MFAEETPLSAPITRILLWMVMLVLLRNLRSDGVLLTKPQGPHRLMEC